MAKHQNRGMPIEPADKLIFDRLKWRCVQATRIEQMTKYQVDGIGHQMFWHPVEVECKIVRPDGSLVAHSELLAARASG